MSAESRPSGVDFFDAGSDIYGAEADLRPEFAERYALLDGMIRAALRDAGDDALAMDLGCGRGHLSEAIARCGATVVSVDGAAAMAEATRARLTAHGVADADVRQEMLPLPDAIVDEFAGRLSLIVCSSVIEYVERDLEVLHQCRRMLRPGGTLLMSFPNGRSLYWIAHRVMRHTPVFAGKGSRHQVHQYTERQIRRAAGGVGLSVLELRYFALPLQRVLRLDTDTRPKSLATLVVARMVPAT